MQTHSTFRPSKRNISIPLSQVGESERIALVDILTVLVKPVTK
jgi:hypothetical protein